MCQLLVAHCITKNEKSVHTHTWFGSGKYVRKVSITDKDVIKRVHEKLFSLTKNQLPVNLRKWNALSEKIPERKVFRFFADIDFKPSIINISGDMSTLKTNMGSLVNLYKEVVERCTGQPVLQWFVATRMFYKFHIHFPDLVVNGKTAEDINETFREAFAEHETLGKYYTDDAVDSSVYRTGLRMLWCHKGNMQTADKLQKVMDEHNALIPNVLYEHCYYLVDPETMLPLPLDITHLAKTSIQTDEEVNCHYTAQKQLIVSGRKETKDGQDNQVALKEQQVTELTEETQLIVKHEITSRFNCYTTADINKIIDYENYLIAAIAKTTCPLKGGEHSKNHPYVVICSNGLRLKCHNAECKTIYSELYPISVELQMALEEHGKRLIPYAEGYLIKNILKKIYIPQWAPDLQSAFTAYLNNYVAMFLGRTGGVSYLYRKTPDEPWCQYSKEKVREILNKFNTMVTYTDKGVEKTYRIMIFETWMTNINRREITDIVLDTTYTGDDPENPHVWNVWTGFKVKPAKVVDEDLIAPILYHIKTVYCADDDKKYTCFMNWLAHLVKEPARKLGTAFILRGPQGTGKNIVLDWFGRKVIGDQHYHEYNSMEDLLNRFNGDSEYKIFCIGNEISNWGGCIKTNDLLKNRITNQRIRIEKKGIDAVSIDDYQNFMFTTNNNWVVRITPDDRRYNVLETSSKYKGDAAYFNTLATCLENDETAEAFLGYLFARPLNCVCGGKFVSDKTVPLYNVHEAIWTDEKKDLLHMSTESITSYIEAVLEGRIKFVQSVTLKDGRIGVDNANLYRAYCYYHELHNFCNKKLDVEKFHPTFRKEIARFPGHFEVKKMGPKESRSRGWAIKMNCPQQIYQEQHD